MSTQTTGSPEWRRAAEWHDYAAAVESRLAIGERDYGDKSFSREPTALVEEIRQELCDVAGWAFVLDQRLAKVAAVLDALKPSREFVSRL